jgi:TRAP-type C4-dicarboxylate transport system permease large subunit
VPVVTKAGIDPVYFSVMFTMNNAIGLLTPRWAQRACAWTA